MASKISLSEINSNIKLVKSLISTSANKKVTRIEYCTFDEGLCDAIFFVLPKSEENNYFNAFIMLYVHQLNFDWEWDINELTKDNAGEFFDNWMKSELEDCKFEYTTKNEIHNNMDGIVDLIIELLGGLSELNNVDNHPDQWGVYINNEKISNNTTLLDLGIDKIESGVGIHLDWNRIDLLYQTPDNYVLFGWGTGA